MSNLNTKYHILVVEDHHLNRRLADMFLTKLNCRQSFCENGEEAVKLVQQENFDLILMDINMPVMDGQTAMKAIRAMPNEKSKIPIVAHSADASRENREQSIISGANAFMPKPVEFVSFQNVIMTLLKSTSLRKY